MATEFRGHIVRLWSLQQTGTQAENSAELTQAAIHLGFVTRTRPVPGTAISNWASDSASTPLWAAQTALRLMLDSGWTPESNQDWCGMAALLFRTHRKLSLEQLITVVPQNVDCRTATGWLVAAIEEDAHYRSSRKLK